MAMRRFAPRAAKHRKCIQTKIICLTQGSKLRDFGLQLQQGFPIRETRFRAQSRCLLCAKSRHHSPKRDIRTLSKQTRWSPDRPRPPEQRRADNQWVRNEFSHGRAGVTESIRSIYADDGTQWQEIATPPQHGRIKAGRATTVQKQSVLASKLIPEKTRELAKRNF